MPTDFENDLLTKIAAAINYQTIAEAITPEDIAKVLNRVIVRAIESYDWEEIIESALNDVDLTGWLSAKFSDALRR